MHSETGRNRLIAFLFLIRFEIEIEIEIEMAIEIVFCVPYVAKSFLTE
jgi:hypothetical protein